MNSSHNNDSRPSSTTTGKYRKRNVLFAIGLVALLLLFFVVSPTANDSQNSTRRAYETPIKSRILSKHWVDIKSAGGGSHQLNIPRCSWSAQSNYTFAVRSHEKTFTSERYARFFEHLSTKLGIPVFLRAGNALVARRQVPQKDVGVHLDIDVFLIVPDGIRFADLRERVNREARNWDWGMCQLPSSFSSHSGRTPRPLELPEEEKRLAHCRKVAEHSLIRWAKALSPNDGMEPNAPSKAEIDTALKFGKWTTPRVTRPSPQASLAFADGVSDMWNMEEGWWDPVDISVLSESLIYKNADYRKQTQIKLGFDVVELFDNACLASYFGSRVLAFEEPYMTQFLTAHYGPEVYKTTDMSKMFFMNLLYPRWFLRTFLGRWAYCYITDSHADGFIYDFSAAWSRPFRDPVDGHFVVTGDRPVKPGVVIPGCGREM